MELRLSASSVVRTARAERFAKQFVSHWGRHAEPIGDGDGILLSFAATADWPASAVRVQTRPGELVLTAWADDPASLTSNCDSIADHLHRFAGRQESLAIDWT